MARRADPARILEAQRERVRQRLGTGMLPHRVDALLAATGRPSTGSPLSGGRRGRLALSAAGAAA
jgi:hypothetical protein